MGFLKHQWFGDAPVNTPVDSSGYFTQLSTIDPNFQDIPVDWTEHFSISSGKKLNFAGIFANEPTKKRKLQCFKVSGFS